MVYDPTAGTGGMLSIAEDRIKAYNKNAKVAAYAQEVNDESYAICKADMLIKGQDVRNVVLGNTLSEPAFQDMTFDYMLSNPPFGVEWKKVQKAVTNEHNQKGMKGRFGPGLPPISDGQMLFLLHLVSKMRPVEKGGSRVGIVMNGSPLFTGGAGSGPSEIRKYLFEHDLVEAIVALPNDMFYNTGISTYIWVLTNKKQQERCGKVQLINAVDFYRKMRRSLGSKRRELNEEDVARIVRIHGAFDNSEFSKVLRNEAFGYRSIVVERPLRLNFQISPKRIERLHQEPVLTRNGVNLKKLDDALLTIDPGRIFTSQVAFLKSLDAALKKARIALRDAQYKAVWQCLSDRDENAEPCLDRRGKPEPDSDLRDTENVPLEEDATAYFDREVKPFVPDAWIDHGKTKIGYEVPFTRFFYRYVPPRDVKSIDRDLAALTADIIEMLNEVSA
jgi:type I restriction enzyme M protein